MLETWLGHQVVTSDENIFVAGRDPIVDSRMTLGGLMTPTSGKRCTAISTANSSNARTRNTDSYR